MGGVLVVDDDESSRRLLSVALAADAHDVRAVATGREAIDLGLRFRPSVLLADWVLKDNINGLNVVQVLQAVFPDLRAILMTPCSPDDLHADVGRPRLADIVEKPLLQQRIRESVRSALPPRSGSPRKPMLAVIEVGPHGSILFANARAREMLAQTRAGPDTDNLGEVLAPEHFVDLDAAVKRWVPVTVRAERHQRWYLRSQPPVSGESRLIVCRPQSEPRSWDSALVATLLNLREYQRGRWPFQGRVLVVDNAAASCGWLVSTFESLGAGCYAVANIQAVPRLLLADEGIDFLVVQCGLGREAISRCVATARGIRPHLTVLATAATDHTRQCREIGIEHFFLEPWRADDLIKALAARISRCTRCGRGLPLRRARTGEVPERWACAHCGAINEGLLDDQSPSEYASHVQHVSAG